MMSLFKRGGKSSSRFNTGHQGDDELLSQISRRSNLSTPRHWIHYLYCQDEDAAQKAAAEIKTGGWHIQAAEPAAQGPGWVVIAEKHNAVTSPTAVHEARLFFENVASHINGGEYDGWEASV